MQSDRTDLQSQKATASERPNYDRLPGKQKPAFGSLGGLDGLGRLFLNQSNRVARRGFGFHMSELQGPITPPGATSQPTIQNAATIGRDSESQEQSLGATLSDEERKLFEEHQQFITAHFETFAEVGERLADIRDRKLYREDFKTFEEFCRTRWKITRRRANQLIQGAEVIHQLLAKTGTVVPENDSETGTIIPQTPLPATERQTRELAKAPPDQRPGIMREATQDGTVKLTARAIKLAAAKRELERNTFLRDAINQIRRHGSEKLADAILLQEVKIDTPEIYKLGKQAPTDLIALAPKILKAKRFPFSDPETSVATPHGSRPEAPESNQDKESAGADPQRERSDEELQAIERIVRLCSRSNPEGEASYRRALSKVQFEDLLDWNREPDENIPRVMRLIHGDFKKGLRQALRIVRDPIDDQTRLGQLENLCNSSNGSFQCAHGNFYNSIIRFDREQIESRFRDLLRGTEHYSALEIALAQNSISEAKLKVLHSMPDEELKYFILCALYTKTGAAQRAKWLIRFFKSPVAVPRLCQKTVAIASLSTALNGRDTTI